MAGASAHPRGAFPLESALILSDPDGTAATHRPPNHGRTTPISSHMGGPHKMNDACIAHVGKRSSIVAAGYLEAAGRQSCLSQNHECRVRCRCATPPRRSIVWRTRTPRQRQQAQSSTTLQLSPCQPPAITIDTSRFVHGVTRQVRHRQRLLQHRSRPAELRPQPAIDLPHARGQQSPIHPYRSQ